MWVAHRLVGAVVAVGVDPAEDQLAAGGGRDPLGVGGEGGEQRRRSGRRSERGGDQRAQAPRPGADVALARAERRAPEPGGGERGDRGGPARRGPFPARPSRRASCRRRGGARSRARRTGRGARRRGWRRSARPRAAAAARRRSPACRGRSPRARARAASTTGSQTAARRRARGSGPAARGRRRSPPPRLREEHLHVADPALAEARLRGAQVEVPEAAEALVVAVRRAAGPRRRRSARARRRGSAGSGR